MREVFLTECLEGWSKDSFDILNLQVIVGDFNHLQEGSDDGVVSLGSDAWIGLFLANTVFNILAYLRVQDQAQFVSELSMGGLQ